MCTRTYVWSIRKLFGLVFACLCVSRCAQAATSFCFFVTHACTGECSCASTSAPSPLLAAKHFCLKAL